MNETKPKRRWFRYSLRTLMVQMFVLGIMCALIARYANNRKSAIATVRNNGGTISFDPELPPTWFGKILRSVFGPETYQPVRMVNMLPDGHITIKQKTLSDDFLARLSALSELEFLELENTIVAETDWQYISQFRRLRTLYVRRSNISDEGVKYISQLPELEELNIEETKGISDAALVSISQLPKLSNLKLGFTKITDAGLLSYKPISNLQVLEMQGVKATSNGVESLKQIPSLKIVTLDWSEVDDKALDYFATLPNLKGLQLTATKVTPAAVKNFRDSHPKCIVTGPQ